MKPDVTRRTNPDHLIPATAILNRPDLIRALTELKPSQRDAWIDAYVLGREQNSWQRGLARLACQHLAAALGSSDQVREAAA